MDFNIKITVSYYQWLYSRLIILTIKTLNLYLLSMMISSVITLQWMLDNPTPSIPANKLPVSDYKLSDYRVNYIAKYLSRPINHPLKPVGLLDVGLSSIHCMFILTINDDM